MPEVNDHLIGPFSSNPVQFVVKSFDFLLGDFIFAVTVEVFNEIEVI
jgi:hypothetical protein